MMKNIGSFFGMIFLLTSFQAFSKNLNTGPWRFELKNTYAVIPFIMDLREVNGKLVGKIQNGKETIKLIGITRNKDHFSIPLQNYEQTLELEMESEKFLKGYLVRHNKNPKVETLITGTAGETVRFPGDRMSSKVNLKGRWAVTLSDDSGVETPGVVVFEQEGNKITGSILTPTGDYRYFEGYSSGESFEAASFDGVYNYVFSGSVTKGVLKASILTNSVTKMTGTMKADAELPDAYKQTELPKLDFKFPNLKGKNVSLSDVKFKNKPVVVQFFGSWCPNCMDEMNFLIPWYEKNHKRGIEVVALAFERSLSKADAKKQLRKVQAAKKVPYTILLAGSTAQEKPMDTIKGLKNFISFPTTVFLNKKHEVVKVHAGFTGPSTGEFYEKWKAEFKQTTDELIK